MTMKRIFLTIGAVSLSISLTSCGTSKSNGSTNLACASVESYESTKALTLVDSAGGGSAVESIDLLVGGLREGIGTDSTIFDLYLSSMREWASSVDRYQLSKKDTDLSEAARLLEREIDSIVPMCESFGWRFEPGWRS